MYFIDLKLKLPCITEWITVVCGMSN